MQFEKSPSMATDIVDVRVLCEYNISKQEADSRIYQETVAGKLFQ